MKVLITGANGLLGQKLITLLSGKREVHFLATARRHVDALSSVPFQTLDITNREQTLEVIASFQPDVVIHGAAMTQVDQCETDRELCWNINVHGVENIAAACEQANAHLIHISTDFIFDGTHGPLDELEKPNPISYYGLSKLEGEKAVQKSKAKWAILRTVLVYGVTPDMSRSNIVLWVKKSLEEGKTIKVVNDQWRTPTLAEDLAMGCYLAALKRAIGIFNISGDEMMTPYDIAMVTANHFGLNASLIQETDSTQFIQPAKRPPRTGFVIEKAKRELGYLPHSFREGLKIVATQLH